MKTLLLVLCAALVLASCGNDGTGVNDRGRSVASLSLVDLPSAPYITGRSVFVRFRALDRGGMPVEGVTLRFVTTSGAGSLSAASIVTDAAGEAQVQWTVGEPGTHTLTASVEGGTASRDVPLTVVAPLPLALSADSITLAGPTCFAEVGLTGVTQNDFRGWSFEGTDVVGAITVQARTGTTSWRYMGVVGRAPGTGRLVATASDGSTASVRVRVLDGRTQVAFSADTVRVAVGDSARVGALASGPCGPPSGNSIAERGIVGDTARVKTFSNDASVATVQPRQFYYSWSVAGVKPGTTRIVTQYYGAADTAIVVVQ